MNSETCDILIRFINIVTTRLDRFESYLPAINKLSNIESINRKLIDEILERLNHDKRNDEQKNSAGREGRQEANPEKSCAVIPACKCTCHFTYYAGGCPEHSPEQWLREHCECNSNSK